MKVLIIGSKGFIGSNLYNYYSSLPDIEVWSTDIVVDHGAKNYFSIEATNVNYELVFASQKFDVCINCVGAASVPDSVKNPKWDFYLNTVYVFDILDAIKNYSPTTKFLNLSSAAVYGNPSQLPVSETDPTAPLSPYGWHKYQSEVICKEYNAIFNIRTCSLRVFSAYGPGLKKQLFWDWYLKTKGPSPFELFGTGKESRDFIFIGDLVHAIACVVENAPFEAEIINVANEKEIFIEDAIEVFKKKSKILFRYSFNNQIRKGDPTNWCADIRILSQFGYKQEVSFESGIEQYLTWLIEEKLG